MLDVLLFRRMVSPIILVWAWSLGSVALVGLGYAMLAQPRTSREYQALALALIVLGPLALRLVCEALIVAFRINETLTDIRNTLREPRARADGEEVRS